MNILTSIKNLFHTRRDYSFTGFLKPKKNKTCFVPSLYKNKNDNNYYTHELHEDKIIAFKKVKVQGTIVNVDQIQNLHIGSEGIHCFYKSDSTPIIGTKKSIEPQLLMLLYDKNTKPATGLIISSFLALHGKTEQFLQSNDFTNTQNIHVHFTQDDYIETTELDKGNNTDLIDEILKKLKDLKNIIPQIALDDLALFKNSRVFYNDNNCSIKNILYEEDEAYDKPFKALMTGSARVYNEMLSTKATTAQKKIDNLLSNVGNKLSDSVIDIGRKVESVLAQRFDDGSLLNKPGNPTMITPADSTKKVTDLLNVAAKIKSQMYI